MADWFRRIKAALTPQVLREEAALAAAFGEHYHEYRARTPRWL